MLFSKSDIDAGLVHRLVATQFPAWADLRIARVELDGHDNRTFRLGDRMLVRLPSAEAYAAQVEKEQRWLPRLGAHLPLAIPAPLAMGVAGQGYPWPWSVYSWLEGETASVAQIDDRSQLAADLAHFLTALHRVDPVGAPGPGPHNFFRGGSLEVYDGETRDAIAALNGKVDVEACTRVWDTALGAMWHGAPVWLHGDVAASNLLVRDGRLRAVIDFGCCGVGDPACDLTIAWTFFTDASRAAFREHLVLDDATWARARGWAIWKALITLAHPKANAATAGHAQRVIAALLG